MTDAQRRWLPLPVFGTMLLLWELAVRQSGQLALYPYPGGVIEAAIRTIGDGSLLAATSGSLYRVLLGFAIGGLMGIPLGLLMGSLQPVNRAMSPIIDSLRSIAPIAWIPMALLWLGIRGNAALFIVAYAAFFPFVVNTIQAVRLIDRNLVNAARALGASRALIVRAVILPGSLPVILTGARISLAFAWGSIIAAELAMGIKVTAGGSGAVGLGQLMVSTLYIRRDVNGLVLYMIVDRRHQPAHRPPHAATATQSHSVAVTMDAKIEARGLSKTYVSARTGDEVEALRDISFRIMPNEFVSIVGPSGCGKSTLLSLVAGFTAPTAGEVLVDGAAVAGPDPRRGVMFQEYALFPWRTVLGNVEFGPLARGANLEERRALAQRYIEMVGLGRLRGALSARIVGRHAPALRAGAPARQRARGLADGRAAGGGRSADPQHSSG